MISYNNYLSSCDIINKYNLSNVNNIPYLSLIVVELKVGYFSQSPRNLSSTADDELSNQFPYFWALYVITSLEPQLKFSLLQAASKKISGVSCLSIKIAIQKKMDKESLLRLLFIENLKKLIKEDVNVLGLLKNTDFTDMQTDIKNKKSLKVKFPGHCLFNLKSIPLTDLEVELTFIFKNLKNDLNFRTSVKNLSNFWIHG